MPSYELRLKNIPFQLTPLRVDMTIETISYSSILAITTTLFGKNDIQKCKN